MARLDSHWARQVAGKIRAGVIEVQKLVVNGVDVGKKLLEHDDKLQKQQQLIEGQQKQIEELRKTIEEMKKK